MPLSREHRWRLTPTLVKYAPDDPGVYMLWENDEVIYIGHAKRGFGLRKALAEHMEGRVECTRRATHYSWEITLIPEQRERRILADYYEAQRSFPRCNRQEA